MSAYTMIGRQGNTLLVTLRCLNGATPTDLTGSQMVFRASFPGGAYVKRTDDSTMVMRPTVGEIDVELSHEETRVLPIGNYTKWELERRIGGRQFTIAVGTISVSEGSNIDV